MSGLGVCGHIAIMCCTVPDMVCVVYRQAQWHADKAVRLHSPPVETALLLKVEALLALGKHAEALNEIRSLTVHGDPMATEVLTVRAQALYLSGTCSLTDSLTLTAAVSETLYRAVQKHCVFISCRADEWHEYCQQPCLSGWSWFKCARNSAERAASRQRV